MTRARRDSVSFGAKAEDRPSESRRSARTRIDQPVEFALADDDRRPGICRNISLGGLHVDTTDPAPFGASITIFIHLPGIEGMTALPGVVRWTQPNRMRGQLGLFRARFTNASIPVLT